MKVAVIGATGQIGRLAVDALERDGHEAVRVSRSLGVDILSGDGLVEALAGVEAVIDATSTGATDSAEVVTFFGTGTANLLAAEEQAGVGHHVLLSIVGIDRGQRSPHYDGKREQERLITAGKVPWTVVRATQFHDFAGDVVSWTTQDGVASFGPLLVQPIDHQDVADALVDVATSAPQHKLLDVAGPYQEDLIDMARRTLAARGQHVTLRPSWNGSLFDLSMSGNVQLPGPGARIGRISFDDWLAAGAR
jgi:uncharacterized protein YbjT (DUF2867 family)